MTTRMDGLEQTSLFAKNLRMMITVSEASRYRILAEGLPWLDLANIANYWRSKQINIHNGRPMNLRLHLGACIAQSMNGWTDRETEDMVKYHAGVKVLCGLENSSESIDHTSIESFRNQVGKEGMQSLNQVIVQVALKNGFTDTSICASDTTVQEAPIAYPTEVGHMKNIAGKLAKLAKGLGRSFQKKLLPLSEKVGKLFTEIRLFTRGKGEKIADKKKELSKKLHCAVTDMTEIFWKNVDGLKGKAKEKVQEEIRFYEGILLQIKTWLNTGFHPEGKIVSLWEKTARAISKGKASSPVEFGRRWIISIFKNGYTTGTTTDIGAGNDLKIIPEALMNFFEIAGELPRILIYDRGADSTDNHEFVQAVGIQQNAIFCKGKESLPHLSDRDGYRDTALQYRAANEAAIATLKHPRYKFNKPNAKSTEACALKGHAAMMGANLNRLIRDFKVTQMQPMQV